MESSTPILVGCGDVTDLTTPAEAARSPFDLIAAAARLALADAGGTDLINSIDTVAMMRLFSDTSPRFATRLGTSTNPPRSVARRMGIDACRTIYTSSGGNMPQFTVNAFAEAIAAGEMRTALIVGGEALRTQNMLERSGGTAGTVPILRGPESKMGLFPSPGSSETAIDGVWSEDPGGASELIGNARHPRSEVEDRHNLRAATAMYPLIENAIRAGRGSSIDDHLRSMGRLFARFAAVAAGNPLAVRREGFSAERLIAIGPHNRWIGFPYPRLLNSHVFIDQAAALVMTSVGEARRLGIPPAKWVYLHGCADAHDTWYVSERAALDRSPAIAGCAQAALEMAGQTLADIRFFDLYSCFPSAVEIGCREIGLAEDDPRGLTVTGGLPFFGGPGNNYVTHSIAEMMRRVRGEPGSFGLVTANGNYVTKHSFGIYSTTPTAGRWHRESPRVLQAQLDALPKAPLVEHATGPATIETYTILHNKSGPEYAVVFGRLEKTGQRFIANTPTEPSVLADLQERESLGRPGVVRDYDGRNLFVPSDLGQRGRRPRAG